jgi:redox-sensitive bicupin YhaK (pirin superfamily)
MITIIPSHERSFRDFGWLKTYWLFSFEDYFDPQNTHFGRLRVFNDDYLEAGSGFDSHPHKEMEIVTIVLDGEITHKDSIGNETVLRSGEVQVMTAGTGIVHSEHNKGTGELHLYQIWLRPRAPLLTPGYINKDYAKYDRKNMLLPVASGKAMNDALPMNCDATIYMTDLRSGAVLEYELDIESRAFVYVSDGRLRVGGSVVSAGDQARVEREEALRIEGVETSRFVLIDLW